jgi:serine/threonine protein kinase
MDKRILTLKSLIGTDIKKYTITRYINSGSFGDVFEARHNPSGKLVALKIPIITPERNGQLSLLHEYKIYKTISNKQHGIPSMKIIKNGEQQIIVMDLLGQSLESLLATHKKFGLKTVILLAMKMISILRYLHGKGYIHRDIKPDNFVIGHNQDDQSNLYLIDYGLSKEYTNKNEHISLKNTKKFCGTVRYASIAAHESMEQSRKDDLETIGYILVYFYKGKLPWQGIKYNTKKERYHNVGEIKKGLDIDDLCSGMPKEFSIFLKYIKNLEFEERPHYTALIKMFKALYNSRKYKDDLMEWEKEI